MLRNVTVVRHGVVMLRNVTVVRHGVVMLRNVTVVRHGVVMLRNVTVVRHGVVMLRNVTVVRHGVVMLRNVTVVRHGVVLIDDPSTWDCSWSSGEGWRGPRLINLAGLFDIWKSAEEDCVICCTRFHRDNLFIGISVNSSLEDQALRSDWVSRVPDCLDR
ncbi:hypothetical protein PR048_033687 [Dryococelus australis]|uniref:Uncharacterized protein n=1 Tax=Dryococelus australis TaxID=614101 RepID=A0ABQ9G1V8_9NEOP|nr:hypothetical protein PR048_033687 [Dryococelus australis]